MSRLTENLKRLEEMGKLNKHHMGILENSLEEHDKEIRNKAIDEFAERLKAESYNGYATLEDYCEDTIESVALEDVYKIAEQLKAGGKNEID